MTFNIYNICNKQSDIRPVCICIGLHYFAICYFAIMLIVDNHISFLEKGSKLFERNFFPASST